MNGNGKKHVAKKVPAKKVVIDAPESEPKPRPQKRRFMPAPTGTVDERITALRETDTRVLMDSTLDKMLKTYASEVYPEVLIGEGTLEVLRAYIEKEGDDLVKRCLVLQDLMKQKSIGADILESVIASTPNREVQVNEETKKRAVLTKRVVVELKPGESEFEARQKREKLIDQVVYA